MEDHSIGYMVLNPNRLSLLAANHYIWGVPESEKQESVFLESTSLACECACFCFSRKVCNASFLYTERNDSTITSEYLEKELLKKKNKA